MTRSLKILVAIITLVIFVFLIIVFSGSKIYTDWLWFKNLGFTHTFLTMFFTNLWLRLLIGIIFTAFIFINLLFTRKPLMEFSKLKNDDNVESLFTGSGDNLINWVTKKRLNYTYFFGSVILGFLFSSISQDLWKVVLKYLNKTPFNTVDPIFNIDLGFYILSLPFFNFIREMGMVLVILTLIVIAIIYTIASGVRSLGEMKFKLSNRAKAHISILIVLFLFLKAWDYKLKMYNLLYSPRGVVFGASYTDIHANLLGLKILFWIVILIGVLLLINLFRKSYKIILWSLGIWILASFIFGSVYPGLVQRFEVEPNEVAKESKYIKYNIDMTLKAYGLDNITIEEFKLSNDLNQQIIENNRETIDNIRLWDNRPLLSTYRQLQELRPYYRFPKVDIDRYNINGQYRQVMLSPREVDQSRLSSRAQTWINKVLKFTHGYGLVMNPVNEVTEEGLPRFFIKDIPPKVNVDLRLDNPSIYYGELTNNYVIANNKSQEFHYPLGDKNIYTNYNGSGGVQLDSFFKKLVYALRFSNLKFLLADDITAESRIMYYRNIRDRVRRVAPFLSFDGDPYLVISQGRLFWIQDAYTTTNRYPYSQPVNRYNNFNYIRNSVKIVIDAFNGSMDFYVINKNDPLAVTYQKIFPDLFKDGEEMPKDIRNHLRYPQDLFVIQSRIYSVYHMKDPMVFYNKEEQWTIPNENYAGTSITMDPYYIIMELPGKDVSEFILMLPFTPATKNNMIAWMAGRSDGDNYGELIVYRFPKDTLVYGPMQIESRIDQNTEISQLLTLWSQRGSRVIRGNLLVIPIDNSILYVEPLYLQAETSELPELKRVIVSYGDRVVMARTLDLALEGIFKGELDLVDDGGITEPDEEVIPGTLQELASRAFELYTLSQESLKEGNWSEYGRLLEELQEVLQQLRDKTQIE
ncbi:UPF0182 family protein [Halothermothrix orenii]|uniref:UPF0182 protein Hore_10710 n=1 Tax=Halothermothrix orenii (strain H 168 / OCM 544 / DSM 9562) TaxID=373903 RepID=B8CX07_HALOH|nr:UPF0182 family protein [Halothermothrix orenii]ACL69826.1 putative glutamate--cysteine ligase/putative amino acid ligase [Halothermothrix orenii H 168]